MRRKTASNDEQRKTQRLQWRTNLTPNVQRQSIKTTRISNVGINGNKTQDTLSDEWDNPILNEYCHFTVIQRRGRQFRVKYTAKKGLLTQKIPYWPNENSRQLKHVCIDENRWKTSSRHLRKERRFDVNEIETSKNNSLRKQIIACWVS